jgi:hypothetical protein
LTHNNINTRDKHQNKPKFSRGLNSYLYDTSHITELLVTGERKTEAEYQERARRRIEEFDRERERERDAQGEHGREMECRIRK